ncbi:hypothetical protein RDI58_016865 [Solanum bulbocastanum]|uniref:Uncharacterized protein n=1 Tax=Solanum bulbocastanum TaxID=147425 RepID=A0AAN8TJR2_SOLBU
MDMALSIDNIVISNVEEISMMKAMHLPCGLFLNMVLRAAIELDLFEIIAKSTTQKLSSNEIASQIPTKNPNASLVLERILRFLASQSFLTCNITKNGDGNIHTSYSLTPLSQSLISDKDGSSIVPLLLLNTGPVGVNAWFHLKDAILEGEIPFNKAHGMHAFEYNGKDSRMNGVFNKAMQNVTCIEMKRIVECYNGFQGVKKIIDVGGGLGISLASIISKYPNIKGINFDLPHVIKEAPIYEGKERTKQQFEDLAKKAGFTSLKVVARTYYSWIMEFNKFHFKDAILEGEIPFKKAHGVHAFEYHGKDSRFNGVFNKAMQNVTCIDMKRILECYNGFQGVKEIIDVGGGLGISLASIISKYPNIKGINFDLPHVIKDAPTYKGIGHVGGDMFKSVPQGELILLKAILHDWDDEYCVKILKNCWRALPKEVLIC